LNEAIKEVLGRYWGYDGLRPLQAEAMECVTRGRDSVVVLPTGGGKSLCFQAPAVSMPGLAIVVSPLISLMKDQVDALLQCGVAAGRLDGSQSQPEQQSVHASLRDGSLKLLYLAPERLLSQGFIDYLGNQTLSLIAIDEAHCISMWGHDFRPEYAQMGVLKRAFPGVAVHAYTATATERVRQDIEEKLGLEEPEVLVGSFDRPNLVYKTQRTADRLNQVREYLDLHRGESGIVYCIRRADVDETCAKLSAAGYSVAPYHAGMDPKERKQSQDAFIQEKVETIVATVAFGMGIDKSNVRYVLHAGMPKSLEHYQQESGRAGRDGLRAECVLLYAPRDFGLWQRIMGDLEPEPKEVALGKLREMYDYARGVKCRHAAILEYFGQSLDKTNCAACDVCLGGLDVMEDSLVMAQKILSCVVRLDGRFGGDYTADVLIGSNGQRIIENGHDQLSTHGLLSEHPKRAVRDWIEQLVDQGFAEKVGDYNVLKVTQEGWRSLKGEATPQLLKAIQKKARVRREKGGEEDWVDVDKGLFEALRGLRRELATDRGVPPYVIFSDASLRDMARRRPADLARFRAVHGVGDKKCEQYGKVFLAVIREYCEGNALITDRSGSGNE